MNLRDYKTSKARREAIEKLTGKSFVAVGGNILKEDSVLNRNIENMIGAVQIPLGIAGKLKIKGDKAKGEFFIPLATSEGALVASVNRGCKAVSESGGTRVMVENVGVTRGPVFQTEGIYQSRNLKTWAYDHFDDVSRISGQTSSHIKLQNFDAEIVGNLVYFRFVFDTMDAMGMNMVTKASAAIVKYIEEMTGTVCLSVAGNFDIDKKPAWLNSICGRGKKVWAEVVLSEKILKETLKTDAESFYKVWLSKCMIGSALSGSLGFNSHFANIIAAIFLATGQDAAHITEGSLGITTTEIIEKKSLYVSVYLPDLMIGTVGGGTGLPAQKEALSILGIPDPKLKEGEQVLKFAEIIAGAVLAGEISLLASLSEGSLAKAHERLGRGKRI
ncbi:MAG: 3-hydroxy-3-methylglutaryl-coenzyme A reductase [Candidatus Gottesmanbacteria bacterium GW2011_GWC2_39_8]|uniref:hydroxymethylglutaryl-CoA reductase (NADPH) n=1 Tax=Candidatus Gottesmanbacteria bacterium GW2011_GWC2_39_8 TaxID=1618450 RepID=A0A0G0T8A2_9BACT|nr:MAG: 3-hydroxy-3-methylglutaryl-coenzyme A reductase [Candidatus Gottesmanbacteria bacterium GW2011_GWC2_39_8]